LAKLNEAQPVHLIDEQFYLNTCVLDSTIAGDGKRTKCILAAQ
jgi:hypothetical protein